MSEGQGPDWPENWWTSRFENEPFLTEAEWRAFLNRPPVRYTWQKLKKVRKAQNCEVCGQPPMDKNKLQAAHHIPFLKGVQHLGLTPEFVDERLVWAHRVKCNAKAELGFMATLAYLRTQGIKSLPPFLRPEVLRAWEESGRENR